MNKKIEEQRFEFVLNINSHIICQRYFNIRDFNEDSIYSLELKEMMDRIVGVNNNAFGSMGIIPKALKNKSMAYLWENYNPYSEDPFREVLYRDIFEKEDIFTFEVKIDKITVASSVFSGNLFPPKVRYQVDIKDIIPVIMSEIRYSLSQKKYTHEYAGFEI